MILINFTHLNNINSFNNTLNELKFVDNLITYTDLYN